MSILLSTRGLRSSWSSRSAVLAFSTFVLPLVPMILGVTILAFVTMLAIALVEVEVTKGLRSISCGRRSRSFATLAFPLAVALGIAGR